MIILTGAAGFIGSCFLKKLNDEGIKDILIVDDLDASEKWRNLVGKKFLNYFQKNDFLEQLKGHKIPKPTHVVHLGAASSTILTDASYYMKNNYEYSKILADWTLDQGARFMYASSAATYGKGEEGYNDSESELLKLKPLNMYGYSKHLFDLWCMNNNLFGKVTGIKFFNVFGPNEYHKDEMRSVICKAFPRMRDEGRISLFKSFTSDYADGEQKRDFIYIKDVVEVMFYLFKNPSITGIYNLGTGEAASWNSIANAMFNALGKKGKIDYIEMPDSLKAKYQNFTEARMGKLKKVMPAFKCRALTESIKDYTEYLVENAYL